MSELTLPDSARSNTVKQLDRRNRGNFECKYMLFLVQISMQIHRLPFIRDGAVTQGENQKQSCYLTSLLTLPVFHIKWYFWGVVLLALYWFLLR